MGMGVVLFSVIHCKIFRSPVVSYSKLPSWLALILQCPQI